MLAKEEASAIIYPGELVLHGGQTMDTDKLLKVLHDIVDFEDTNKLADQLDNLSSLIAQNTSESYGQADEVRKSIGIALADSPTNKYAPSYSAMVVKIESGRYIGNDAIAAIDEIFGTGSLDLTTRLNAYIAEYRQRFDRFRAVITSLENIDLIAYEKKEFEIGFLVPRELNNIQSLTNNLFYWDVFLVKCSEIAGDETPSIPLSRISNGTFQFFVLQGAGVAAIVEVVLKHVLALYKEVLEIKKINAEIGNLDASTDVYKAQAQKALAEAELSQRQLYIDKAADEVMDNHFKGSDDRKPELRTQFAVALKVVLADIQKGIRLEVSAPDIPSKDDKEASRQTKMTQQLAKQNVELKKLYSSAQDIKALPFEVKISASELQQLKAKRPFEPTQSPALKTIKRSKTNKKP